MKESKVVRKSLQHTIFPQKKLPRKFKEICWCFTEVNKHSFQLMKTAVTEKYNLIIVQASFNHFETSFAFATSFLATVIYVAQRIKFTWIDFFSCVKKVAINSAKEKFFVQCQ